MKLVYRGIYKNKEQLPKSVLPENAKMFKEPKSMTVALLVSTLFVIPALFGVLLFMIGSFLIHGDFTLDTTWVGLGLVLLSLIPHELLHAICFGKDAQVDLYIAPKQLALFVVCTRPITKARFIFLSLFPSLLFGWLVLAVWMILPYNAAYSGHLFTFSFLSILAGAGDYMNVFNAITQMPKGSMQQLSGFNSYWFMP